MEGYKGRRMIELALISGNPTSSPELLEKRIKHATSVIPDEVRIIIISCNMLFCELKMFNLDDTRR